MVFVPAPGVIQADLIYTCQGEVIQNSLYVDTDVVGIDQLIEVTQYCSDLWDRLKVIYGPYITLNAIQTRDLTTQDGLGRLEVLSPPSPGTNVSASTPLPNNTSLAIRFTTGARGRSRRGRNYLPPLAESQVVGNTVNTAVAEAIQDAYDIFRSDVFTASYSWVVVSRIFNGQPRTTALVTPITGVGFFDLTIDTQRRRLPR